MSEARSPGGTTTLALYAALVEPTAAAATLDDLGATVCDRLAALQAVSYAFVDWRPRSAGEGSADAWAGIDPGRLATLLESVEPEADLPTLDDGDPPVRDLTPALEERSGPVTDRTPADVLIPLVHRGEPVGSLGLGVRDGVELDADTLERLRGAASVLGRASTTMGTAVTGDGRVLEVELESAAIARPFREVAEGDVRVVVDEFVADTEEALAYLRASGLSRVEVRAAANAFPAVSDVRYLGIDADEHRFEARLRTDGLTDVVSGYGGRLVEAVIAKDRARIVATFPAGVSLPDVLADLRADIPDLDLVAKQTVARPPETIPETRTELLGELTDRQLSVLRAAHRAGYFEWPRASTGEEVAEALDVSPPTFHQHVREGQQHLFDRLFDDPDFFQPED